MHDHCGGYRIKYFIYSFSRLNYLIGRSVSLANFCFFLTRLGIWGILISPIFASEVVMRRMTFCPPPAAVVFLYSLLLVGALGAQTTTPTNTNDGSAYGGPSVSVGSVSVEPTTPGAPPSGSVVCYNSANQTYDPCVLTGQYDRSRNSTNVNASNLASFSSPSTFGLAYFYQLTSTPPTGFGYEPVVAQPL